MGRYPTLITAEVLAQVRHVNDEKIRIDIAETQAEIDRLRKEVEGYRLIAEAGIGTPQGKMAAFRRDGKQAGLDERLDFVRFLEAVLEARQREQVE